MRQKISQWLPRFLYPTLIVLIVSLLFWTNYEPGTILSGWDSLHPEFNLTLYLKRAFFGAWQEHQGVGAPAAQAHAAELTRLPLVYLLGLVFSPNLVRYLFFFLMLTLGSLGVYYLVRYILSIKESKFINSASFLASLFYLLNLATLGQFYVPLEMFALHFASLPWLFFLVISYLREGKKKSLFWFILVTLLSSAVAHTATLFYVYLGALVLLLASTLFLVRRGQIIKRGVLIFLLVIFTNLFWLLPNFYYIKNHSQEVTNSKIHRVFSDEAFLQSKAFGNFSDLGLLKNFLFNWREYDFSQNKFVDLMDEWESHLGKPGVSEIGYITISFALFGIVIALVKRSKYALVFLPLLLVSVFFWLNSNSILGRAFDYLRDNLELFREGLRFPFTKFSILLTLTLAVYLSFSVQFLMEKFSKLKLSFLILVMGFLGLIYFMQPSFKGNLVSPSMKVNIPKEYFELFDWFKTQDKGRIAKLPLNSFWGWNFYSWDYQGAGFTWFGIENPTLDREFDRWSPYNESFFNQASLALYSFDNEAFEKTLEKYQVKYLVLDESIVNAGGSARPLLVPEIKEMLRGSSHVREVKKIGFLTVYKTDFNPDFVFTPETFTKVDADLTYSQIDPIYSKYNNYIQSPEGLFFPFVNFDRRGPVKAKVRDGKVILENKKVIAEFEVKNPTFETFGQVRGLRKAYNCDIDKKGGVSKEKSDGGIVYKAWNGGVACDFFLYSSLSYSQGYLLRVKGKNFEGRSLKIYLQNMLTGRMDLEELLPRGEFDEYFFILPQKTKGEGFTLNLETRSYGKVSSQNKIEKIEFYPINIQGLINLYSDTDSTTYFDNSLKIDKVEKIGGTHYFVKTQGEGLLTLGQGYEDGWQAFVVGKGDLITKFVPWFLGQKLAHTKVNSWANGWFVPQSDESFVVIVYWPQYLEYLGLVILCISLIGIIMYKKRNYVREIN